MLSMPVELTDLREYAYRQTSRTFPGLRDAARTSSAGVSWGLSILARPSWGLAYSKSGSPFGMYMHCMHPMSHCRLVFNHWDERLHHERREENIKTSIVISSSTRFCHEELFMQPLALEYPSTTSAVQTKKAEDYAACGRSERSRWKLRRKLREPAAAGCGAVPGSAHSATRVSTFMTTPWPTRSSLVSFHPSSSSPTFPKHPRNPHHGGFRTRDRNCKRHQQAARRLHGRRFVCFPNRPTADMCAR